MKAHKYILVSNVGLPSKKIGSWTIRINSFIERNPVFDFILSPSKATNKNLYCKKKSFITWHKRMRKLNLLHWVAKDYLTHIFNISKEASKLTIVVMDDPHLIEAIAIKRSSFNCPIELIYSFHGFELKIGDHILNKVDKVLFLTETGYKTSLNNRFSFTPEVEIVGNSVNSKVFYPLKTEIKQKEKQNLGFSENDVLVTWMSNDREIKGLHLFKKIISRLSKKHTELKFVIIGSNTKIEGEKVFNIGKVPNNQVSKYLQISDFYFFTTLCKEGFGLSLIEAIKSGNKAITSNNGAVPEITNGLKNVYINESPNIIKAWEDTFEIALRENSELILLNEANQVWNYEEWEMKFLKAITNNE